MVEPGFQTPPQRFDVLEPNMYEARAIKLRLCTDSGTYLTESRNPTRIFFNRSNPPYNPCVPSSYRGTSEVKGQAVHNESYLAKSSQFHNEGPSSLSVRFPIIDSEGAVREQSELARTSIDDAVLWLPPNVSLHFPHSSSSNELGDWSPTGSRGT